MNSHSEQFEAAKVFARKLGGCAGGNNGDAFGAVQQTSEIGFMIGLVAWT